MKKTIQQLREEWAKSDALRDQGLTVPAGLRIFRDIPYRDSPALKLDVYCPENAPGPLPAIISIHGGSWCYGDKTLYSHYCMRLALRGFAVVNFDYRLAPEYRYPAALEDCVQVLHWVRKAGTDYGICPDQLFLVGDSAGGQLALQLLTMLSNPSYAALFSFSCPQDVTIRACGLNCGCYWLPFTRFFPPKTMGQLFEIYFPEDYVPILPQLKPEKFITPEFPPAFVMSAEKDYLRFMAPMLHKKLQKAGAKSLLKIYGSRKQKDIGHVFHLNCRSPIADQCNDDQCAFFRQQLRTCH